MPLAHLIEIMSMRYLNKLKYGIYLEFSLSLSLSLSLKTKYDIK